MSTSPAAGLARLRVTFPRWSITRADLPLWQGYVARRGEPGSRHELVLAEKTLASLELALRSHPGDRGGT